MSNSDSTHDLSQHGPSSHDLPVASSDSLGLRMVAGSDKGNEKSVDKESIPSNSDPITPNQENQNDPRPGVERVTEEPRSDESDGNRPINELLVKGDAKANGSESSTETKSAEVESQNNPKRTKFVGTERKYTGRCSPERLSGETSRQDRRELASALSHVLRLRISDGKSIYLEGLGVLFPDSTESARAYMLGSRLAVRRETLIRLNFERAGELSPFIRERYHGPLELSDLIQDVYRYLPLAVQMIWTPAQMRFYLGGLVALLRREIVLDGFSHRLAPFCSFYSLHNRHGDSTVDWFAGADIFVRSELEILKKVEQPKLMERARFDSIAEFGEIALGMRKHIFPLNIAQALNDLGVSASRSFYPDLEVIVLERAPGRLAFLTKGAKDIPLINGKPLGAEFVIDCELFNLAAWPFTVLAAAIENVVSGTDDSGYSDSVHRDLKSSQIDEQRIGSEWERRSPLVSCIPIPAAAFGNSSGQTKWAGALISEANSYEEILLEDGSAIRLLWITPVTESERALAARRTCDHLVALLSRKGSMLTARLDRASVLFRTEIL